MQNTLDIRSILDLFLRRIYWIILAAIAGFVLLFCYSKYVITPMYTASTLIYVDGQKGELSEVNKGQLDLNRSMVSTYVVLLESREFMQEVASDLSKISSAGEVMSYISMGAVNETEVLEIRAITPDPKLSAEICNSFANKAPGMIEKHIKGGEASVISRASVPAGPSSPNIVTYSMLGVFLGLAFSCAIIFLINLLDNTVKGQDEIAVMYDVPVLGEIPEITSATREGTSYVS